MGTELYETLGYWDPRFGWDVSQNKPTAGEYQAIGLDLQGSSPEYAAKLQADLEATKAKLESADEAQLADLTKQDLVGNMLEATIFSYFAMNNLQDDIAAQQANIVNYRQPSYGKFSTSLSTSYWYGTPRSVTASGLVMDVDRVFNSQVDKDNIVQNRINFNKLNGNRLSAMEHLIPEQMFSTPEAPAQGISAVKAIALASAAGQKIWTITQDNLDVALAAINLHADSETEIRNGVNAGNVVTAHEQSINFNGWVGEGYIIVDPTTGAGAYKIAGGGNGAVIQGLDNISSFLKYYSIGVTISYAVDAFLGKWIALVATIVTLLSVAAQCSNGLAGLMIGIILLSAIMFLFVTLLTGGSFALLAGNIGRIALNYLATTASDMMVSHAKNQRGC
jgi:hypothetical protein